MTKKKPVPNVSGVRSLRSFPSLNISFDMPQAGIDFIQLEPFRVEFAADPVQILLMFLVVGVKDRRETIGVPADAAAILGRAGRGIGTTVEKPHIRIPQMFAETRHTSENNVWPRSLLFGVGFQ